MTHKSISIFIAAVMLLVASAPLQAQARKRPTRVVGETASLSGTVTDAADGSVVFDATVAVGRISYRAGADGRYELTGLAAGPTTLTVSRWGYDSVEQAITLSAGANRMDVKLQPKGAITLVDRQNRTYKLDYETAGIASRGALSGNVLLDPIDFCLGTGEIRNIEKRQIASLRRSSNAFDKTKCCPDAAGVVLTVTLKSGESFDGLVRDCIYYAVDFIGRDRSNGKNVYLPLADVESVTFP